MWYGWHMKTGKVEGFKSIWSFPPPFSGQFNWLLWCIGLVDHIPDLQPSGGPYNWNPCVWNQLYWSKSILELKGKLYSTEPLIFIYKELVWGTWGSHINLPLPLFPGIETTWCWILWWMIYRTPEWVSGMDKAVSKCLGHDFWFLKNTGGEGRGRVC